MLNVLIHCESRFKVEKNFLTKKIENFFKERGIKTAEIGIILAGDRKMKYLNQKFRKINKTTPVLVFPLENPEAKYRFVNPPDQVLRLGDIVISYPQAVLLAAEEHKLVDQKIEELVEYGLKKLLN